MLNTRRRAVQYNVSDMEDEEPLLDTVSLDLDLEKLEKHGRIHKKDDNAIQILIFLIMVLGVLLTVAYWLIFPQSSGGFVLPRPSPCDTIDRGYQCAAEISHSWGQYSPYYLIDSEVSPSPPQHCNVTFVQLLSRHGSRYPTPSKSIACNETITKLQQAGANLTGIFGFLRDYVYDLGADDLTDFGRQELANSGIDFFSRYESLAAKATPFIRASGQGRVIESARKWSEGYHKAKIASGRNPDSAFPYDMTIVSEAAGMNNTLSHSLCPAFESSRSGVEAQKTFRRSFLPHIESRFSDILGDLLHEEQVMNLMDMCPYSVVAESNFSDPVAPSKARSTTPLNDPTRNPFCALFNASDWENYDYYQSLGKYYGHGPGSALGPTQGVGFVNELIARLTGQAVEDHTTVNHTLDDTASTFPLDRTVYADFSHDNDMTHIFSALRLFEKVPRLDQMHLMASDDTAGYSASRTVPFAGRMIIEKLDCGSEADDFVRVILNGRVWPLEGCNRDNNHLCKLTAFINSLSFARKGGDWEQCFMPNGTTLSSSRVQGTLATEGNVATA